MTWMSIEFELSSFRYLYLVFRIVFFMINVISSMNYETIKITTKFKINLTVGVYYKIYRITNQITYTR